MLAGTTLTWRTVQIIHTRVLYFASSVKPARLGNTGGSYLCVERSTQDKVTKMDLFFTAFQDTNIFLILLILFCKWIYFLVCSVKPLMWDAGIHLHTHLLSLSLPLLYPLLRNFLLSSPAAIKQQHYSLHWWLVSFFLKYWQSKGEILKKKDHVTTALHTVQLFE